jgi:hypothetical protein
MIRFSELGIVLSFSTRLVLPFCILEGGSGAATPLASSS